MPLVVANLSGLYDAAKPVAVALNPNIVLLFVMQHSVLHKTNMDVRYSLMMNILGPSEYAGDLSSTFTDSPC